MNSATKSNSTPGISRRDVMVGTSVAAATVAMGDLRAAEDKPGKGFIDAHVHVWTPDLKKYPLDANYSKDSMKPASFTPDELMTLARKSQVDRVVLIQMSFYGFDNSYMLHAIRDYPGTFSGVAVIDENDSPGKTMKSLKPQGVRGFRIASRSKDPDQWLAGAGMREMWTTAADEGMTICPLINPQYLPSVDKMCEQFPRTTVVMDHFARCGIDGTIKQADLDALCRLARHKNVHVKTSAFYALGKKAPPYDDLAPMILRCREAFGSNRLMWATDCPFQVAGNHTFHESIDLVRQRIAELSSEDKDWILRKTAEKVFFS